MPTVPGMITCMCVTRRRPHLLRRSIECFHQQTYPNRELLIVYDDEPATREVAEASVAANVRAIPVAPGSATLGALRNLAVESARGEFVAQWDDDDVHMPLRLASQMAAITNSGREANVLYRWLVFDAPMCRAFISHERTWEGSILARKANLPRYPDLKAAEDTPVIEELQRRNQLSALNQPDLYVYFYHGANVWDRSHWESNLFSYGTPVPFEDTLRLILHFRQLDALAEQRARPRAPQSA